MGRTKLVKLSEDEYNVLVEAQKELMAQGINSLPEDVRKEASDFALGNIVSIGGHLLLSHLKRLKEGLLSES